jgi:hypothetical protein
LATVAQALPTATVVGNREQIRLALVGFEERKRLGQAPPSHFINRASIDSVSPARLTEMFDRLTSRARSCKDADAVYIDGLLIPLKQDKAAFALKKPGSRSTSARRHRSNSRRRACPGARWWSGRASLVRSIRVP